MIVWAINNTTEQLPINFNGLLGDAILRPSDGTHVTAYNPVSFQAVADVLPGLPTGAEKDVLDFDGFYHYRRPTDRFFGSVRYADANTTSPTRTFLTLLTLSIDANTTNNFDNNIELLYYNENEVEHSAATNLICWKEVEVPSATDVQGVKGLFSAYNRSFNSLLGLIRTEEEIPGTGGALLRGYAYSVYNDKETDENAHFRQFGGDNFVAKALSSVPALPPLPLGTSPSGTTSPAPSLPIPKLPLPKLP